MNRPVLHLDQSNHWRGLYFAQDGQQVGTEEALQKGFTVEPNDTPAVCSLLQQFIQNRDANHG